MRKRQFALALGFPGVALFALAAAETGVSGIGLLVVPALVILALVGMNGFFVAAEFALIGVRRSQLAELADDGHRQAGKVLEIISSPGTQDRYIATAQLGVTMASLGLGMYGEPRIAGILEPTLARLLGKDPHAAVVGTAGYIVALSLLTYLHIVLGEMVPKSVSLASPIRAVLWISHPMILLEKLFAVPVFLLNRTGNELLRLFKVPVAQGKSLVHSPEEIELIVAASAEEGLLDLGEEEMIRNIFDFGERVVGQVMTPRTRVQAVPNNMPYEELKRLVTSSRHSRFPVYEGDLDHIIGILHLKDLVKHDLAGNTPLTWRALVREAPAVPEGQKVEKLLAAFKRTRMHMAVVTDEFGGMAGIVTLEDLVEEVVGEVRDEFDQEKEPLVQLSPGVLEVAGTLLVSDLSEEVDLGRPEDLPDVETVGGLIVSWLGRPPVVGDHVAHGGAHGGAHEGAHEGAHDATGDGQIHFTVLEVDGLAVVRAKVEFPVVEAANEKDE